MRCTAYLVIVAVCLGPLACSSTGKKSSAGGSASTGGGSGSGAFVGGGKPAPAGASGILAGQVIDSFNRRPSTSSIQVVALKDGQPAGAPVEVACDTQGFFTIQSLQAGTHYQLTARVKDSGRVLSGQVMATPPDPRLLIRVSEDFTTADTPAMPGPPAYTPDNGVRLDRPRPSGPGGVQLDPPARSGGVTQAPLNTNLPENRRLDINIHGPGGPPGFPQPVVPGSIPSGTNLSSDRASVPSCALVGNKLENFALSNLDGSTWEFRQHRGRLVLLDFWGTWCGPCREAIPHLKILDQLYRPAGLEVVGIAYEDGRITDQVRKVGGVAERMQIGYRLLLGTGKEVACPVRDQFRINGYPTLILLDETGHVIWRSEGGLDRQQFYTLETEIRRRLVQR